MNKEWAKFLSQIISGTISGIFSGLIVVFAQKGLERRIKKLENEEKKKNEQEEYSGMSKTLIVFKKMHMDNSRQSSWFSDSPDLREITPNGETN